MTLVFGLEGHEGCKVAANIIHGLDCSVQEGLKLPANILQSNPYKMFAAYLQPSWPSSQKIFADAITNFLISTKSISDKNCYDQLFINKVVQIFTFQFDESVTKFYLVKVFQILMKFSWVVVKYHKIFLVGTRKKITSINFSGGIKNWKMAIFGLHYIKVSSFFMPMKWTCKIFMNSQFKIQANCNDHVKFHRHLLIRSTSKLNPEIYFFCDFLVP